MRGCAGASAAAILVAVALGLGGSTPAAAQCVQVGSDVTCTGMDPDGFPSDPADRPPVDDDLDITVATGALVEDAGGSGATILLLRNNRVTVQDGGTVRSSGGRAAISGAPGSDPGNGDPILRNVVTNGGILTASGMGAVGVLLGDYAEVVNQATGQVLVAPDLIGGSTAGIVVGANGSVVNDGLVSVTGDSSFGINAGGGTVTSSGTVQVHGASAVGIAGETVDHSGTTRASGEGAIGLRTAVSATNSGVVEVTGDFGAGMFGASQAEVTNAVGGSITVTGDSAAALVATEGGVARNEGQVSVSGTGSAGLYAVSQGSAGQTQLFNAGTVTVSGDAVSGVLLGARAGADNEGLLDASAANDGAGVRLAGNGSFLTNSGTVRGGTGAGAGIVFADRQSPAPEMRTVVNRANGVIESANGIAVRGGNGVDAITNHGSIVGDVLLGDGDDGFGWVDGSSVSGLLDGEAGDDRLHLVQSDPDAPANASFDLGVAVGFEELVVGNPDDTNSWTLTGTGDYPGGIFASHGELRVDPSANVANEITVDGGRLLLEDGLSLPAGVRAESGEARFEPGAAVATRLTGVDAGRITLDGSNAVQGEVALAGGVLEADFSSTGTVERLDVDGDLSFGPASRLQLIQSDAGAITGEPVLRVMTASGSRSGHFGDIDVASPGASPFLRGIPTYGAGAGIAFVDVQLTTRFQPIGHSPNERRVGQYLDDAVAAGVSPDFQAFLDTFPALTNSEAAKALDSLHGAAYDAQTSTALATATRYAGLLARRPARCERLVSPYRRDEASLSPCGPRRLTPWIVGFGLFADRNGGAGEQDYSHAGGGIALGVDQRLAAGWMISGLLGTSRSALDLDDSGDGSYTSFEAGVGAAWSHAGGTRLRGSVEYGHGWHTTHRRVSSPGFSRLALSDHESDRVTLLGEVGHRFTLAPVEIEPLVSVDYIYLAQQSIRESSAGVVALDIDSQSTSQVATQAGLRVGMTLVKYAYMGDWLEWADGVWRPELEAGWRQVWSGYDRDFDARLEGAPTAIGPLRVRSADARYGAWIGGSVGFQPFGTRNSVALGYDAFVGDGTTSHTIRATFRMPF